MRIGIFRAHRNASRSLLALRALNVLTLGNNNGVTLIDNISPWHLLITVIMTLSAAAA